MSRVIDVQCAEALGWTRKPIPASTSHDPISPKPTFTIVVELGGMDYWEAPDGKVYYLHAGYPFGKDQELPHYSTDPMAAISLENEIERRRLQSIYLDRLAEQVGYAADAPDYKPGAKQQWLMVCATPMQRAQAFLKAMREL